ncbi:MAG: ATP-grasp domain-containing protein [Deltaproteobacteria bacterium]|nr:ATP-grasp domain-containing protein [Deltaproteobacteria bacterium]
MTARRAAGVKTFDKVLIANRGEIACRLIAACSAFGVKSVAVYSDADAGALHARSADEAVAIGGGSAEESYLNVEKLLAAAAKTGAGAVHPGYGFLSERAHFAHAVESAGLVWVGPSPKVIDLMGNKIAAKLAAENAKIPTLPWARLAEGWSLAEFKRAAKDVGLPLLLKDAAGGGGRGMRIVKEESELEEKAESAAREATGAFGSSEMFLESFCAKARHIEVQVLGDTKGNVMVFGERDCSSQRRRQKVIEESPAPNLSDKTRSALWKAARTLAKAVGYVNAGTCEFLVDENENFYFLEMNTRLQVEHPVTELVWGVDLPVLQLQVARGDAIPEDVLGRTPRGHAIEARIYAEDPSRGHLPSPGTITDFSFSPSTNVRIDAGCETGSKVPIFYDAMLAKVIAWGMSRAEARVNLREALSHSNVSGVAWNGPFLVDLLEDKKFIEGRVHTEYIEEEYAGWKGKSRTEPARAVRASATTDNPTALSALELSPWFFFGDGSSNVKLSASAARAHALDAHDILTNSEEALLSGPLIAEYPGKVLKVNVRAGDRVKQGEVVVVCESMKMEFAYPAPADSEVKAVHVKTGAIIPARALLVEWSVP